MRGFRSPMLGALLALACLPAAGYHRLADEVESILDNALSYVPDLPRDETMDLLLADVNAGALVGTRGAEHEARRVADDVIAWANGGRCPVIVEQRSVGGAWHYRVTFTGPGNYAVEVYSIYAWGSLEQHETSHWLAAALATRAEARRQAVDKAGELERAAIEAFRLEHEQVPVSIESGPYSKVAALGYDEFAAKYGIRDDLVKPAEVSPEAQAKREAWFAETAAFAQRHAPSGSAWSPEDAADMAARLGPAKMQALREYFAEHPDAKVAVVGIDHGREVLSTIRDDAGRALAHVAMPAGRPLTMDDIHAARPVLETDFERAQRLAMNTPADRAFASVRKPPPPKPAYSPPPPPRPDWPPRYSAKPKPAKPPKGPEARAQQRERKAGRTAVKKRRGWS